MFELTGISKHYGETLAVRHVELVVASGQTTVLIGPSGCGKSTLLRLMVGLIQPDTGSIHFEDERLTPDNAIILRRKMGFCVQDGGLFPHLTARENATIMTRYLQWDTRKVQTRLDELKELTHFPTDAFDRYPLQLSGGQCQRVSLMRALMLDPDVLLLDEPLGALDPMIRHELQADLRNIFQRLGKTVVMVTHDLAEAGYFADTTVLMREGCIVQKGKFNDLIDRPADQFVTQFVSAQRGSWESNNGTNS